MRNIPEGATIVRTYLAIPGLCGIGDEFPNTPEGWADAVEAAQAKKAALVESITESLGSFGTPDGVEQTANVQVRIDLRWKMAYPQGGGIDTVIESYKDVDRLRPFIGTDPRKVAL